MSVLACCTPCPTTETVNVPGVEGDPGTDGTNGLNAFTTVTTNTDPQVANFGDPITLSVVDSTWIVVGQNVFVEGAGYFVVTAVPTSASVTLQYLDYAGNTEPSGVIAFGAGVSPGGTQPSVSLLPAIPSYQTGGSQALTTTPSQALTVSVTLTETRSYLLMATARFDCDVATIASNQIVSAQVRRTNNTPANITNAVANANTGAQSASDATLGFPAIPPVVYAATAGDIVQLYVSIDNTPYAGAVNVVEASLVAIPIF